MSKTIDRRHFSGRLAGLAGSLALSTALPRTSRAEQFPSRPITLICPWTAGGPTDVVMRAMADVAGRHLGQPVVVDNKAGANGTIGPSTMAAVAKPDGYTLAQMTMGMIRQPLMQKASFDTLRDFTYITLLTGYIFGVSARGESPFKSWASVIEQAKGNPGRITYGHTGAGGSLHIGMEQMAAHSGVKLTPVPFKGESEAFSALIGGHVDLMAAGTGRRDMIDSGQIRILNIWTQKRSKRLPDVPSIRELGYPFTFDSPWGFAGPRGMEPQIVAILHEAFKKALEDPAVMSAMEKYEMQANYKGPDDYRAFVTEQIEQERGFLGRIGLLKKE